MVLKHQLRNLEGLPDCLVLCFSSKFGYTFVTLDQCSVLVRQGAGLRQAARPKGYPRRRIHRYSWAVKTFRMNLHWTEIRWFWSVLDIFY